MILEGGIESNRNPYRSGSCQSVAFEDMYGVTGHDERSQPRILSWRLFEEFSGYSVAGLRSSFPQ